MALQTINLGTYANDGTGDDLRTAFQKVNANLIELYSTVSGCNVGAAPPSSGVEEGELWWSTVEGTLYIYYSGAWVVASTFNPTTYDISAESATGGANLTLSSSALTTDSVKFAGSTNITVTRTDANTITISSTSYTGNVTGNLTGNADTVTNGIYTTSSINALADVDTTTTSPTTGQGLVWNGTTWIPGNVATTGGDLDFGTFASPTGFTLDLGTF